MNASTPNLCGSNNISQILRGWLRLAALAGISLAATALLSGCALTKAYVGLAYKAQDKVERVAGAEAVKVKVQVADARTVKDRVSVKKNGYGMEMALIIATNDVADLLTQAIQTELSHRGFVAAGGSAVVAVELSKCYSDFKMGFWSGSAQAEVVLNAQVKSPAGDLVFSKLVTGEGHNPGIQITSGENAKIALDSALNDAVAKLVNDSLFIGSLFKAVKGSRAEARATP